MDAMAATTTPAAEFGQHLTALHQAAGEPSYGVISRTILINAGITISDQSIGNYHQGKTDPRKVRRDVLKALCRFYGCTAVDLGPVAAAEVASLADLMASDERFQPSGWLTETAA